MLLCSHKGHREDASPFQEKAAMHLWRLESFAARHRNALVMMTSCSQHAAYQLPNEHSRVGYFLSAIESSDSELQAAIASIKQKIISFNFFPFLHFITCFN